MNYFIDFEAMQFSEEIISVGCVDENGREFYTLVKPSKIKKLTSFITQLTGITADDLQIAPSVDEAFADFYRWSEMDESACFYAYGGSDKCFVRRTMRHATDPYAKKILSFLYEHIIDYTVDVKKHFMINNDIALKKLVEYYRNCEVVQHHNALEDALFLKEVHDNIQTEVITITPFPEHKTERKPKPVFDINTEDTATINLTAKKGSKIIRFTSVAQATDWLIKSVIPNNTTNTPSTESRISHRIKAAVKSKKPYCGYTWRVFNIKVADTAATQENNISANTAELVQTAAASET